MKITRRNFLVGAVALTIAPALLSKQAAGVSPGLLVCTLLAEDGSTFERKMPAIDFLRGEEFFFSDIRGVMTGYRIKDTSGNVIYGDNFRFAYNMDHPLDTLRIRREIPCAVK